MKDIIAADPTLDGANIDTVFMIGDNPESDIAGANAYESECGYNWQSVLVETGVYRAGIFPTHQPNYIASNVTEAIEWALESRK